MDTVMILIYVVASLLALILAVAAYSGLFHRIDVQTLDYPLPRLTLAYKFYRGSYNNVGSAFQELCRVAPGKKSLALYYDNPCQVRLSESSLETRSCHGTYRFPLPFVLLLQHF